MADAHSHDDHGGRAGHDHGGRAGLRGWLGKLSHSHDHAESIDSALTADARGIRAVKVSLGALLATAAAQLVVVAATGSVALLADTAHNFADALTAVPLWVAFAVARRRPTKRYTYGYGRGEDLAGLFIILAIAASAVFAGVAAVERLIDPREITHVPWVVAAGVIGFAGNEAVAVYRIRTGRSIGSAALVADGLHARTDGLTSLAVVAGGLGSGLGYPIADPLVALGITVAILVILRQAARQVYRRLMDAVEPELVDDVHAVLAKIHGIESVQSVRIRWVGHELHAEAEVTSDADLSLRVAHTIGEDAHHALQHEIPRLARVIVHTNPCEHDGTDHHAATAHHLPGDPGDA